MASLGSSTGVQHNDVDHHSDVADPDSSLATSGRTGSNRRPTRQLGVGGPQGLAEGYGEVSFLSLVQDVLLIVEKDNQEATQRNRDSLEAAQRVQELTRKVSSARNFVYGLSGIAHSPKVQDQRLQNLRKQLQMKRDLIEKYRSFKFQFQTRGQGYHHPDHPHHHHHRHHHHHSVSQEPDDEDSYSRMESEGVDDGS